MGGTAARGDRVVVLIGVFKLAKAAVLGVLGSAAILDMPAAFVRPALHLLRWAGGLPGHHTIRHAFAKLLAMDAWTTRALGIIGLGYAAVFLVEGVGLMRRRRWAEWLTVVVTASFIPIEIYELVRRRGGSEIVALAVNGAIVLYLVWRRLIVRA
jgi:uncharacterized membrane protein (DUF2068 family)